MLGPNSRLGQEIQRVLKEHKPKHSNDKAPSHRF